MTLKERIEQLEKCLNGMEEARVVDARKLLALVSELAARVTALENDTGVGEVRDE